MRDLAKVHPDLKVAVEKILKAMEVLGHPMMVTDTLRTEAEQVALYTQGRTKPGRIVTNVDGVKHQSNHQAHEDGYGHAVDCCFLVNGKPSWDVKLPWQLYGKMAETLGLVWGGSWISLHDLPHVELP